MVRDLIKKDKEYFDAAFAAYEDLWNDTQEKIRKGWIAPQFTERRTELYWLYEHAFDMMLARYSRGDELDEVLEAYHKAAQCWITARRANNAHGTYYDFMYMISISVLLGVLDQYKDIFSEFLEDTDCFWEDWLLHFLLTGERTGKKLLFESDFLELKAMTEAASDDEISMLLKRYLQYWYRRNSEAPWYGTHLLTHDPIYTGYWSFESAAMIKLLGVDDSAFKKKKYYPYDLVHYKD